MPSACAASRAGCWTKRPTTVSREEVRRRALSQERDRRRNRRHVLQRLAYLGFVRADLAYRDRPGRPTTHWLVNPALAESEKPVAKLA